MPYCQPYIQVCFIRDLTRGTSQLYLRVAWTSAFKEFFLLIISYLLSAILSGPVSRCGSWGPFLESLDNYQARKLSIEVSVVCTSMIKLSVNKTKWTGLSARTRPFVQIFYFNSYSISCLKSHQDFRETGLLMSTFKVTF